VILNNFWFTCSFSFEGKNSENSIAWNIHESSTMCFTHSCIKHLVPRTVFLHLQGKIALNKSILLFAWFIVPQLSGWKQWNGVSMPHFGAVFLLQHKQSLLRISKWIIYYILFIVSNVTFLLGHITNAQLQWSYLFSFCP